MSNSDTITHETALSRFTSAFRLAAPDVARRRHISERTGICTRTLDAYSSGQSTPGLSNLMSLAAVLGPAFLSDVLAPIGMVVTQPDLSAEDGQMLTDLLDHAHRLSEALDRGFVSHKDQKDLAPSARALGVSLIGFAAKA